MTKLTGTFRNFSNAPKTVKQEWHQHNNRVTKRIVQLRVCLCSCNYTLTTVRYTVTHGRDKYCEKVGERGHDYRGLARSHTRDPPNTQQIY